MKKIIFICPYFGEFPNYFNLTLSSIKYNKSIDWLIITDIKKEYNYPDNVKLIYSSFNELKQKIQSRFDFKISLEKPYKLCDYKPAYGFIFYEYIKEYDFWGYCDFDCIYGNIRNFITEKVLTDYSRIYYLGHLSLYKNNEWINNMFKKPLGGKEIYKEVYSNSKNFAFDERQMIKIFNENGIAIFNDNKIADIYPYIGAFNMVETVVNIENGEHQSKIYNKQQIFKFERGTLECIFLEDNKINYQEKVYIHLQKRFMYNNVDNEDIFYIVPNKFIDNITINEKIIKKYSKRIKYYRRRLRWKFSLKKRKQKIKHLFRFLIKKLINKDNVVSLNKG